MPMVLREGGFSSRKHKRSIISQSGPFLGRLFHAHIFKGRRSAGRAVFQLAWQTDRAFETLQAASVGQGPSYRRAELGFKQLTIYAFNAPDVFAT